MPQRYRSRLPDLVIGAMALALGALALRDRPHRRRAAPADDAAFGAARSSGESAAIQRIRARESGRGREAASPTHIPWSGWKDIVSRTYRNIGRHRVLAIAAGIVFYGLLALFPAIAALISSYGIFADPVTVSRQLAYAAALLPPGAFGILEDQVNRLVDRGSELNFAFAFGLALSLWSVNAGMKAMIDALNIIYEEEDRRGFFRLTLISLFFSAASIAMSMLALGAVVVLPAVLSSVGLGDWSETLLAAMRWPILLAILLLGLAVLYRYGPHRRDARWKWVSAGSLFAAFAWLGGSALLSWYIGNFANYDATYGSLGAGIGLMMWLWMTAIVILVGAELNAAIEHQTARDTTVGARERPLGERGATMADTVGAAQRS